MLLLSSDIRHRVNHDQQTVNLMKTRDYHDLRGTSQVDEEVRHLAAWTTRKDYPTTVGIALPVQDWVGNDFHVIQFWEELTDPIPVAEHPAAEV
jgi:hypothetical protein